MVAVEKIIFAALRAMLVTILILGSVVGAALGLILGTAVPVNASTSCSPCNPLTHVSEGMRAALVPEVSRIRPWVSVVLGTCLVAFTAVGIRLFLRRAID